MAHHAPDRAAMQRERRDLHAERNYAASRRYRSAESALPRHGDQHFDFPWQKVDRAQYTLCYRNDHVSEWPGDAGRQRRAAANDSRYRSACALRRRRYYSRRLFRPERSADSTRRDLGHLATELRADQSAVYRAGLSWALRHGAG